MDLDQLVSDWLTLPDLAEQIDMPLSKVRQLVREGRLIAIGRGTPPVKQVPAAFVSDGKLIKGLHGALTVLRDAGYRDDEALRWLFTESDDPAIPGRPVDAMAAGRDTAVKRHAMSLAF